MKNSTLFYEEEFPKQILDCSQSLDKLEFFMADFVHLPNALAKSSLSPL